MDSISSQNYQDYLNTSSKNKKQRVLIYRQIYILLFGIILILAEIYLRNLLKNFSIKYFFSQNTSRCEYFLLTDTIFSGIIYLIVYISYNYINVFAALSILFINYIGIFFSGNLQLIYKNHRPFVELLNYPPCNCKVSYGNPSTSIVCMFLVMGSFYQGVIQKKNSVYNKILCSFLWFISVAYIAYSELLQNLVFLNQVLYGIGIGYIIYYIIFHVIRLNYYNYQQMKIFLEYKYLCISALIILFFSNIFIQFTIDKPNENINEDEAYKKLVSVCPNKDPFVFLERHNYIKQSALFTFLGYYLGILMEYCLIFKGNSEKFQRYNLKEMNINGIDMFSNTKADVSFYRLIIFCMCHYIFNYRFETQYLSEKNFLDLIWSLPIVSSLFIGIFEFFVVKYCCRYLGATNEHIFDV